MKPEDPLLVVPLEEVALSCVLTIATSWSLASGSALIIGNEAVAAEAASLACRDLIFYFH